MVPEQRNAAKTVGARADVYALGKILQHLFAGQPPFEEDDIPDGPLRPVIQRATAKYAQRGTAVARRPWPRGAREAMSSMRRPAENFSSSVRSRTPSSASLPTMREVVLFGISDRTLSEVRDKAGAAGPKAARIRKALSSTGSPCEGRRPGRGRTVRSGGSRRTGPA